MRAYEINPANGASLLKRKKWSVRKDREIKKLALDFDKEANPTDQRILDHLYSLQFVLLRKNFDDWYEPPMGDLSPSVSAQANTETDYEEPMDISDGEIVDENEREMDFE